MRLLSALFNFAAGQYLDTDGNPLFTTNPVKRLSQVRGWARVERRMTVIKPTQLKRWWNAVQTLDGTARDYLTLLLLTGLRREEAAKLQWRDIDFDERTLSVQDTKNRQAHVLPLSNYLADMLTTRYAYHGGGTYVFPGRNRTDSRMASPQHFVQRVVELTGIQFSAHDLRRTLSPLPKVWIFRPLPCGVLSITRVPTLPLGTSSWTPRDCESQCRGSPTMC